MATNTTLCVTVAERIRKRRIAIGMSQTDLAEAMGISQPYICDIERGRRSLTVATIERIATALGVTPKFFFGKLTFVEPLRRMDRLRTDPVGSRVRRWLANRAYSSDDGGP